MNAASLYEALPPSLWYLWKLLFVLHQQTFLLSFLFEENLPYCAKIGPGLRKNALLFMREVSGNVFLSWEKKRRRRLMKDGWAAAFPPWLQNKTPTVLLWRAEEIYLGGRGLCNTIRKDSIHWIFRCDQMTSENPIENTIFWRAEEIYLDAEYEGEYHVTPFIRTIFTYKTYPARACREH